MFVNPKKKVNSSTHLSPLLYIDLFYQILSPKNQHRGDPVCVDLLYSLDLDPHGDSFLAPPKDEAGGVQVLFDLLC